MQSNIAVTNKHTAKLHHFGSLYILTYDAWKLKHKRQHTCYKLAFDNLENCQREFKMLLKGNKEQFQFSTSFQICIIDKKAKFKFFLYYTFPV